MDSLYVLFQLVQQIISFTTVIAYVVLFNWKVEMVLSNMVFKLDFGSCHIVTVFMGAFLVLGYFSLSKADCPVAALLVDCPKTSATLLANKLQLSCFLKLTLLFVDRHLRLRQGECLATHRAHTLLLLRDRFPWLLGIVKMKLLHVVPQSAGILETSSTLFTRFPDLSVNFFTAITQVFVLHCLVGFH